MEKEIRAWRVDEDDGVRGRKCLKLEWLGSFLSFICRFQHYINPNILYVLLYNINPNMFL